MALMKSNKVPDDAVELDEDAAITYAWDIVSNWESFGDSWALRYAPAILGGINSISGILINSHFRNKLKLGNYGYFSSVIPISIMPGLLTALYHRHSVSTQLLLMKKDTCPLCYEMRSAGIQCMLGIAYPLILAPTSGLMFAHRYNTARIPDVRDEPKAVFQYLSKIGKSFSGTLMMIGMCQLVASSVLTYFEMRNHLTIRRKILQIENKLMVERGLDVKM